MTSETGQKAAYFFCFVVISVAVVGYFTGLQSPMNPALTVKTERTVQLHAPEHASFASTAGDVLPATGYADMAKVTQRKSTAWQTNLADLKSSADPLAEFTITPQQKTFALAMREQNRAFNGAPPTIPHPIEQLSTQSCLACHGEGIKTETMRVSKMSHQFLENCTQCHAEGNPQHMTTAEFRENSFVGLPAPTAGPRAFVGAPPMIPHSTWMRVECMSCHGASGLHGIRSTHPWRQNCQQCHAPSSKLDQTEIDLEPKFLPPPEIEN